MRSLLDKSFRYTPVKDQGHDYLKRKFDRIRAEQRRNAEEAREKVQPMKRKSANG